MKKINHTSILDEYFQKIDALMCKDRYRIKKKIELVRKNCEGQASTEKISNIIKSFEKSKSQKDKRETELPRVNYNESLPVFTKIDEIKSLLENNQVVIIAGETGSGKTTQIPQICLEIGRGSSGYIGHTQPRRIAAKSIAERLSYELGDNNKSAVGYKVRFQDSVKNDTYIKLMTDGILLAEMQSDRYLTQYDTIIIDEAHERNLNIDFLLGCIKRLLPKRPDLKLIITSATIDTQRFSKYFDNAPVLEVSGKTFPVDVRYLDPEEISADGEGSSLQNSIFAAIDALSVEDPHGDILIFFNGEREIRDSQQFLSKKLNHMKDQILPLFSRLSGREQEKIFQKSRTRKIILSTNIAETSLTVPGIKFVIDTGLARINRYNYKTKIERLPIEKVSQANANQRKGRCGRVSHGLCYRLYTENDFSSRPEYPDPEIKRVNLASVILQMKVLKLGPIEKFEFIEPPDSRFIKDGYRLLHELQALDNNNKLTGIGRILVRIPLDPKIARMIIAGQEFNSLKEILVIASVLSLQDPRERPYNATAEAEKKQSKFNDKDSDFLAFFNLWSQFTKFRAGNSNNQTRKWCKSNFLSYQRMREWQDIHNQLADIVSDLDYSVNEQPATYENIHKSLLTGMAGNLGFRDEKTQYVGARNINITVSPASIVAKKPPKWIVAGELIETKKLYAHIVAKIKPEWLLSIAPHLTKHHFSEPHWSAKEGRVLAYERVTLYGLPIAVNQKVNYESINPVESREIFIHTALVAGELDSELSFYKHNQDLIDKIRKEEEKARTTGLLVSDETMFQFYDELIPDHVVNRKRLQTWIRKLEPEKQELLKFTESFLTNNASLDENRNLYPESISLNNIELKLEYNFDIGSEHDGVTVIIPGFLINQLNEYAFEWSVPGMLKDKIIAIIKTLPKKFRRSFVPVPDYAQACLEACQPYCEHLIKSISTHLTKITGVNIPPEAWVTEKIPQHFHMNYKIVNRDNKVEYHGKDFKAAMDCAHSLSRNKSMVGGDDDRFLLLANISQWDFGDLDAKRVIEVNGYQLTVFPSLHFDKNDFSIRLYEDRALSQEVHRDSVIRLYMKQYGQKVKYLRKNLRNIDKLCLHFNDVLNCEQLKHHIVYKVVKELMYSDESEIRSQSGYTKACQFTSENLVMLGNEICAVLMEIAKRYKEVNKQVRSNKNLSWIESISDINSQLELLITPDFVKQTTLAILKDYIRYLDGISLRLKKLENAPQKDSERLKSISPFWEDYRQMIESKPDINVTEENMKTYHILLEEMRISLFAQELGTGQPVSIKRLQSEREALKTSQNPN